MPTLSWHKQPLVLTVARSLRASTRPTRPEIDGHRFCYEDLRELWASDDECHVAFTHTHDRSWQYWFNAPQGGWTPISVHTSRAKAQAAALHEPPSALAPGTYVLARDGGRRDARVISVQCTTTRGPQLLCDIFAAMGYVTEVKEVSV